MLPIVVAAVLGGLFGLGGFVFSYASGSSYLSDDPAACVNCHVMREMFESWNHSSHKADASCNDCHAPKNFLGHWTIKGLNGWQHSRAFTLNDFHEPIQIKDLNRRVALQNCLRCHGELTSLINCRRSPDQIDCLHCHAGVGHGD
jgi:cytochrome c nitrite reductase small subunit